MRIETMAVVAAELLKAVWAGQVWLEMNGVVELNVAGVAQLSGVIKSHPYGSRLAVLLTFLLAVLRTIWEQADCKFRMAASKTSNLTDKRRSSFGTVLKVGVAVGTKLFA